MAEVEEQTPFQSLPEDKVLPVALQAETFEDLNKGENEPVFEANTYGSPPLKLKIPKFDFIEDLQCRPLTDALRTCSECGKQFTSGKALGGHKRACLQKKNSQKPKIKNMAAKKSDRDQMSSELNICYVCQQGFRSLKSLYGHMRKHPDRQWRGIQPPPQRENQCISSTVSDDDCRKDEDRSSDNSAVDLVETFQGWSVKAKRGNRLLISDSRFSTSVSEEGNESEAMQQAVSDLMLLAQIGSNDLAVTSKTRGFDHVSSVGPGYGLLKIKEKRPEAEDIGNKFEVEGGFDSQEIKNQMFNSEDTWTLKDYDDESEMEISNEVKQQKKKKRRLNELEDMYGIKEEPVTTVQTYSCPLCNKVFDKHQALGGHVASHNKIKNVNIVKESSPAWTSASAADDRNSNTNTDSEAMEKDKQVGASEKIVDSSRVTAAVDAVAGSEHQCNVCNKSFQTGQALGGHKRCHWTGQTEAFSSSSQVSTSAGEVTQRAPRVVRDFDLNDKPPEYYQFHGIEATASAS